MEGACHFVLLAEQEVSQEQFQILGRFMDALFEIRIIGTHHRVTEIPGVFGKNVIGHIEQIENISPSSFV